MADKKSGKREVLAKMVMETSRGTTPESTPSPRIHECCLNCQNDCKDPYRFWSGCMPCSEYCETFKRRPGWWRTKQ